VRKALKLLAPLALVIVLAFVPTFGFGIGSVFPGPLSSPGTLQLLAVCLVFSGVALSYDLLFGFTGLLSFGHALYFAAGAYISAIAVTKWHWSFTEACLVTAAVGLVLPAVVGWISLRTSGIAFAMVTLAFAQAGEILVQKDPHGWTGGNDSLGYDYHHVPAIFVGVFNTKNLYLAGTRIRGGRLLDHRLDGSLVSRARVAGDPRERTPRRGARAPHAQVQAARVTCSGRSSRRRVV